ncbi:MAG: PfkB family carbohydrate kinase [Candidatus Caldatribacteriota bacterium]
MDNQWSRFNGVVVIGGANIDLRGKSGGELIRHTSNPGKVNISTGGVGRNIAHNLALLNIPVVLLSAVGDDGEGIKILEELQKAGVNTDQMLISEQYPTGIYIAILNQKGEMEAGISDMPILEEINIEYLRAKAFLIKESRFVVIDTNLSEESIEYAVDLCNKVKVPLLMETVSVEKSKKLRNVLFGENWGNKFIDYMTPNQKELEAITSIKIENEKDLDKAIEKLRSRGVRNIIVTMGEKGVYLSSSSEYRREDNKDNKDYKDRKSSGNKFMSPFRGEVIDVTGAGDALVAGLVYGISKGYSIEVAARFGLAAAALTVSSKEAVRRDLAEGLLINRMEREET